MGNTPDTSDTSDTSDTDTSNTITLYHYTTEEGRKGILESGVINQSDASGPKDDAFYGNGVYLTSIPPSEGKVDIACNNYDSSERNVANKIESGYVDNYVAVELKRDDVKEVARDRDIYVYQGDLNLDDAIDVSYGEVED